MFDTYADIFEQRADAYHSAMRKWARVRDAEFRSVLEPLRDAPDGLVCDMPSGGGYPSVISLVGVLAGLGVPNIDLLAGVVALAIVATLLLQAAPAPWLANRLGLLEPAPTPPG